MGFTLVQAKWDGIRLNKARLQIQIEALPAASAFGNAGVLQIAPAMYGGEYPSAPAWERRFGHFSHGVNISAVVNGDDGVSALLHALRERISDPHVAPILSYTSLLLSGMCIIFLTYIFDMQANCGM